MTMKELPILFSAPMVRAILDGRKTMTRRSVEHVITGPNPPNNYYDWHDRKTGKWLGGHGVNLEFNFTNASLLCPYGKPGDRLWVRETFAPDFEHNRYFYRADCDDDGTVPHLINGSGLGGGVGNAQIKKWKPSIHMPREASRIMLEVVNVRVERLNDISEDDAIAEGVERYCGGWKSYEIIHSGKHKGERHPHAVLPNKSPLTSYRELWESLNGPGSWDLSPWVWVVEFKPLEIARKAA